MIIDRNSNEIIDDIIIAGHKLGDKISFEFGHAKNMTDRLCFKREFYIEDKEAIIEACVPLELKSYETAFGEETADQPVEISLRFFETGVANTRIHNCFNKECLTETIDKFLHAVKNPVRYESKKWGSGIGFEWNDEQLLIPLPPEKITDPFESLDVIHKGHFDKIEKID